ncbi:type II CRISPR-associated endonuclease Cas1 [Staphylococcus chromogenes]|uniref:type II CRISPR-associated endonuclease Cas1 n=1 Tax=Staphylococcus chromogenes TaxID=46126 RepID=UPI000D1A0708|nr:type II CRISPR-associated endonuclease Cas1 [Staphylococcus chromogenes]MDT0672686.1 type II CRISPR-associated endonuclease Cas1 [Staphylococcus chromogenes]MDT0674832.1 type II CRISPR-associated endonuclease Cas1 [Staphylococcus chromogenes]PTF93850.1 type II CRISPR-associated endonuclease Cas1 [Staphylococcus chromogenes]PTG50824.1 type II CRISPR-associated endonuclease Cas1 [Staphylococcus chromogenes]
MSWRIVYASDVSKMSLNLNSLKVTKGDLEVKIPLSDIFAVVIEDLTVTLTARLLVELSDYNILVILCNQKHLPECMLQPISGHFSQYGQMKEQLSWNQAQKDELWKRLVQQKISNQIECMRHVQVDPIRIEKMQQLQASVKLFDRENIEGQAAKYYFNSFFTEFTRDNDDLLENAVLNYGYTILNSAIARTIVAKGLIPAIGIHHIGGRNHFNLASDLIEPFRPLVDLFLLKHPPEDFMTKSYRLNLVNLLHARIEIDGKMQTVIRAIDIMIQSMIEYFREGRIDLLKFPNLYKYEFYEL